MKVKRVIIATQAKKILEKVEVKNHDLGNSIVCPNVKTNFLKVA